VAGGGVVCGGEKKGNSHLKQNLRKALRATVQGDTEGFEDVR